MAQVNLDQGVKQIKFKQGTRANVDKTAASNSGVPVILDQKSDAGRAYSAIVAY